MTIPATSFTLMIVGDQLMICDGLRELIKAHGIEVHGTTSNGDEAVRLAAVEKPDVILLDIDLAGGHSFSLISQLREVAPDTRILGITTGLDQQTSERALRLGAMGLLSKRQPTEVLIKAIKKVNDGEVWIDRTTMGSVLREMTRRKNQQPDADDKKIQTLTDREHQVIALIAEGLKNKQIAKRLFISETTVTHHLSSIFAKLDVSDRLELVIYSFGHDLARLP